MQLKRALRIAPGEIVAFTGAGGKTSALFRLGTELASAGWRVVGTTTTYLSVSELALAPRSLAIGTGNGLRPAAISRALTQDKFVFLYRQIVGERALGLSVESINALSFVIRDGRYRQDQPRLSCCGRELSARRTLSLYRI